MGDTGERGSPSCSSAAVTSPGLVAAELGSPVPPGQAMVPPPISLPRIRLQESLDVEVPRGGPPWGSL